MNAIKSSNIIIGGFLNLTNPRHFLKCKQKIKLENKKLPPPPCLEDYSKKKKVKEGDGEKEKEQFHQVRC